MATLPNFFIIGAPKCGTSAMSEYLRTHPRVFMSNPKEPGFFSEDYTTRYCETMDEYLDLFSHANSSHSIVAEASTFYIDSDHAVQRIKGFQPSAKLMIMLRRPAEVAYAYHAQMLRQGKECEWDFQKAWELQTVRARGKKIPPGGNARQLNYKWIGSLGSQVENVLRIFPRRQVHFIFFDDFVSVPRSEYLRLLEFLEIPDDGRQRFPKFNENVQFKSRRLARLPRYLRAKMGTRLKTFKRITNIRRLGVVQAIDRFNAEIRPRPPLRGELRRHLNETFRDEVVLLELLLGRDLAAWRSDEICGSRPDGSC